MLRIAIAAGALLIAAGSVIAQSDPIAQRRALMKGNGDATKDVGGMLKGAVPFDLAKVQAALKVYVTTAKNAPGLFPDNSKTGGDTGALPKVWEDKPDFEARFDQFGKDATAAMASITDEASFKTNMGGVLKSCGGCHELYRVKQ